jgi:hypothetical protein
MPGNAISEREQEWNPKPYLVLVNWRFEMARNFVYVSLFVVLIVATSVAYVFEIGGPVSRRGLRELQVTDHSLNHPAMVSIDGGIISSSLAVNSVKQHRSGRCVVIVVRQVLVREGRRSGRFRIDVPVSDKIDEIAFGDSDDVIWHR